MPRLGIGSVDLSPRKASWYKVIGKMNSESMRVRAGKALEGHIPRFIHIYVMEVEYLARTHKLTWEQMYVLLDSDRDMPFTSEDIEWVKTQPTIVFKDEELQSRGRLGVELSPQVFSEENNSRLSLEAVVALDHGFRSGLDPNREMPEPSDLSPWAVGFRLSRQLKEEINHDRNDD